AIQQALAGKWQAAVQTNLEILKTNQEDIDTLCRLAKAYTELGQKKLASQTYRNVLKFDRFNQIAKKNLVWINKKKLVNNKKGHCKIDPGLFLGEPGKTKVVPLIKLAPAKILLALSINETIKLLVRKHSISVYDDSHHYLAKVPDDLSARLIKLIRSGNHYKAVVKSFSERNLTIFIKEEKRSSKNADIPSFPLSKEDYHFFIPQSVFKREPIEEIENPEV
ncbi:MAG TPA: hypothetical protein VMW29_02425, partial [Candidatus Bathyarchaeia archaeon]|nr:hypothetical protein [Candidatus Bathyarchaeia archaeon]